jgi:hypothetical protein
MPSWPLTLQQRLESDGFSIEKGETVIRSEMDVGPVKVRRRSTRPIDMVSASILLTAVQYAAFETFYNTTTNGGTTPFDWVHPITEAAAVFRFSKAPQYQNVGNLMFKASFQLEIMP